MRRVYLSPGHEAHVMLEFVRVPTPHWLVMSVHTRPGARGQGLASTLLRQVTRDADQEGVVLHLDVLSDLSRESLSDDDLASWYTSLGWRSTCASGGGHMLRPPART